MYEVGTWSSSNTRSSISNSNTQLQLYIIHHAHDLMYVFTFNLITFISPWYTSALYHFWDQGKHRYTCTIIVKIAPWLSSCLFKSVMGLLHIAIIFVHRPHLLALFYAGEPPKQTVPWQTQMDEWMVQTWSNSDNNNTCPVQYLWVVFTACFHILGWRDDIIILPQ